MKTKGIILAGGLGTRLYPLTKNISKHLLPVYNKPLIFYPLSVLILSGIKDILIITNKEYIPQLKKIIGDGKNLGLNINYEIQKKPAGIAEAFIIGKKFINKSKCVLILGDNIFFGNSLVASIKKAINSKKNCSLFAVQTKNPNKYGVFDFSNKEKIKIVEKPEIFISNWVVPGIYVYNTNVTKMAKKLKPSKRNELEITDLNNLYLSKKNYTIIKLGRGICWFDAGSFDSLLSASTFVKTIQDRLGEEIGDIYESAYKANNINYKKYLELKSLK